MEVVFTPLLLCSLLLSPEAIPWRPAAPALAPVRVASPLTEPGPLTLAIRPGAAQLQRFAGERRGQVSGMPSGRRSWISRHPVLVGSLLGAAGGAVYAGTANNELFCGGNDEDCLIYGSPRVAAGAGLGAGIGALVGLVVGLAR